MEFERLKCKGELVATLRTRGKDFLTERADRVSLTLAGIPGDRHSGFHKMSSTREKNLYPKGTPVANHRQWSALSVEELAIVAERMGIDEVLPEHLGANFMLKGIPNLTQLPPFTRIRIGKAPHQATLVVYEENLPCRFPQEAMEKAGISVRGEGFQKAAFRLRGLVGWVEKGGRVAAGDPVEVLIPVFKR